MNIQRITLGAVYVLLTGALAVLGVVAWTINHFLDWRDALAKPPAPRAGGPQRPRPESQLSGRH